MLIRDKRATKYRFVLITLFFLFAVQFATGYSGGDGLSADTAYQIGTPADWMELMGTSEDWTGKFFQLSAHINLSGVAATPIGNSDRPFTGTLDGNHFTVSNLYMNSPLASERALFGNIGRIGKIKNLGVVNADVRGKTTVGLLAAASSGIIYSCHASGIVSGNEGIGGLVGVNNGTIISCYAEGEASRVSDEYGGGKVGGLIGANYGSIIYCYATGAVRGINPHADYDFGGLVGENRGHILNCYASGPVIADSYVGGLAGDNRGTIIFCYAKGSVSGHSNVGGLVGCGTSSVTGCFWDVQTSGTALGAGDGNVAAIRGITTAQMITESTFTAVGWNFEFLWTLEEKVSGPKFQWDSGPLPNYSGGVGTHTNPFVLSTATDWRLLSIAMWDWDKCFILASPINLAGSTVAPVGNSHLPFSGVLDGSRHAINNLYMNSTSQDGMGLFGHVGSTGKIGNLGVVNADVRGTCAVGILAGYNSGVLYFCHATGVLSGSEKAGGLVGENSGDILYCRSAGAVSKRNDFAGSELGGFVGSNSGNILYCYATGNVSGSSASGDNVFGGLAGRSSGTIQNCFATVSVSGDSVVGGLLGRNNGSVSHSYAAGAVSGNAQVGGFVGEGHLQVMACFWDVQASGTTIGAGSGNTGGINGRTTVEMMTASTFDWDFDLIWIIDEGVSYPRLKRDYCGLLSNYSGGLGSYANPFILSSRADWHLLMTALWDWDKHFVLAGDIDLEGIAVTPVGHSRFPFSAVFDGGYHTISNAQINLNTMPNVGLFGVVRQGQIYNLGGVNIAVRGSNAVGGLVGLGSGVTITSSYITGTVQGGGAVGGLVGKLETGSITSCHVSVTGRVFGFSEIGGLVGYLDTGATISSSHVVTTGEAYVMSLFECVGGLVGYNKGVITNSFATANVTGFEHNIGGLVGNNPGVITDCSAAGAANGKLAVGGLVGSNNGTINSSYATGTAAGEQYVGGLVGYNTIGTVSIGSVSSCYATGAVTATAYYLGGLAGWNMGIIAESYATGAANGSANCLYVGGLIGQNYQGKVIRCYSTGRPSGKGGIGGLCGSAIPGGNYENTGNFWDVEKSATTAGIMGTPKTTAEMGTQSTFLNAGWDFTDVWFMPYGGAPQLLLANRYSGGRGTPTEPYRIGSVNDLYAMMGLPRDWDLHFVLTANLDLAGVMFTQALIAPDTNPLAAGFQGTVFCGVFDGGGHVISNLHIDAQPLADYVGLFGFVGETSVRSRKGRIHNLGLAQVAINGFDYVGSVAGKLHHGTVSGCSAEGVVYGGGSYTGGLIGYCGPDASERWTSRIENCYSRCKVGGNPFMGGSDTSGGLIGMNYQGVVSHCYSTGLTPLMSNAGGLCGQVNTGGSYADIGNFWDTTASKTTVSAMGVGMPTTGMMTRSTFFNKFIKWDFSETWAICETTNYPRLQWQVPTADWVCPDGVAIEDLAYLAVQWLQDNCGAANNCGGADLDASGSVNLTDFAAFSSYWMNGV
jgi:hypothetical protein